MKCACHVTASVAFPRVRSAREDGPSPLVPAEPRARWAQLYEDNARYVAWFASRLLSRRDEVEDIVQEVFLIAARNLETLSNPAEARGWLKTVALRRATRRLRWQRVRTGFGLLPADAIDESLVATDADPEASARLRQLLTVLETLPTPIRIAWSLRYLHEERLESVAELCGCSLSTAKRRIEAAQLRITEAFNDG